MRGMVAGMVVGGLLVGAFTVWWSEWPTAQAQVERPGKGQSGELIGFVVVGETSPFVAVVDPQTRVLGVYEIHPTTGAISLRSVRNLSWDLQLEEFNTGSPNPKEIRALIGQGR